MDTQTTDLQNFHMFVTQQLADGHRELLPEDAVELWRANNPTAQEMRSSFAALDESIDDLNAGRLQDFDTVNQQIRQRHGWGKE